MPTASPLPDVRVPAVPPGTPEGRPTSAGARNIPSLDGLRALSVAAVVLSHYTMHAGGIPQGVLDVCDPLGTIGVRVFFVISGFLITTLLLQDRAAGGEVRLGRFYFRRLLRIFPPYYAYLGVATVLAAFGTLPALGRVWPAWAYVSNVAPSAGWYTGHTWSLSVEEQFYLTWPFAVAMLDRRWATRVATGACLLMPGVRLLARAHYGDEWMAGTFAFDFLAAGCLLALAPHWVTRARAWIVARGGFLVVALLAAAVLAEPVFAYRRGPRAELVELVGLPAVELVAITAAVAWCVAHPTSHVGRILNSAPLRVVGVGSYSIYLWQQLFLSPRLPSYTGAGALAATAVMAAASYFLVERPSLGMREWLEGWWRGERPPRDPRTRGAVHVPGRLASAACE